MSNFQGIALRRSIWFAWFGVILHRNQNGLEVEELPTLPSDIDPIACSKSFVEGESGDDHSWMVVQEGEYGSIKPLLHSIFRVHGFSLAKISILRGIGCILSFSIPIVMGMLVSYFDDSNESWKRGISLALALGVLSLLQALLNTNASARALDLKLKLQSSLTYHVYFRSMSLPVIAWKDMHLSTAQVNNLIQVIRSTSFLSPHYTHQINCYPHRSMWIKPPLACRT